MFKKCHINEIQSLIYFQIVGLTVIELLKMYKFIIMVHFSQISLISSAGEREKSI